MDKNTETFNLRLSIEDRKKINKIAEDMKRTVANTIRILIQEEWERTK